MSKNSLLSTPAVHSSRQEKCIAARAQTAAAENLCRWLCHWSYGRCAANPAKDEFDVPVHPCPNTLRAHQYLNREKYAREADRPEIDTADPKPRRTRCCLICRAKVPNRQSKDFRCLCK